MTAQWRALSRSDLGRRLTLATTTSGIVWGIGTAATFALGVMLARALGPAGYGVYGTAVALVMLLAVPAQLGLPLLATREIAVMRQASGSADLAALGWSFTLMVAAASAVLVAILVLTARVLPFAAPVRAALPYAAALLPPLALSSLAAGLLRGQQRVVTSQTLDVLIRPLVFVAALALWPGSLAPEHAIVAQILATGLIAVTGFALFFAGLPKALASTPTLTRAAPRLRGWVAAALPMTWFEMMRALENSYILVVAGLLVSATDTGLLRVAMACSVVLSLPISLQGIVTAPFLAAAFAQGQAERLGRIVAASTLFMTLGVGAALLLVSLAGHYALALAFGEAFGGAFLPLMLLGANQLLAAMLGPGVLLLSMTGGEASVARAFTISVLSAISAGVVLTVLYGIAGAAASMLVGTLVRAHMLNRQARRALDIDPTIVGALRRLGQQAKPRPAETG